MKNFLRSSIKLFKWSAVRSYSNKMQKLVLGIETSCDETGSAVVDEKGQVLGEGLSSQLSVHLDYGGVIPYIASFLHNSNIENVVSSAIKASGQDINDISAFAATAKPGLKASLSVGLEYGKKLAKKYGKPFIPVHHMEAHSLTIRMVESIEFPFLVLLASGGHCQIAVVNSVTEFLLLGNSQHNSPGEVLDKIARRLKLRNLPSCYEMCGGQAIEYMAKEGDPSAFKFPYCMVAYQDCNFSFSGFGSFAAMLIEKEERLHDVPADGVIPSVKDLCASVQHAFALHLMHRIQRAFVFCEQKNLLPSNRQTLVFSGGVACNQFLRNVLKDLCNTLNYRFACPPPKLCTDNGIMIAWNAMEKLKAGVDIHNDFDHIVPEPNAALGLDLSSSVKEASIKVKLPKLELYPELSQIRN